MGCFRNKFKLLFSLSFFVGKMMSSFQGDYWHEKKEGKVVIL